MSKELFLLRHAQAAEKQQGQPDQERMLDRTGLQNATKMGIRFMENTIRFDQIITSPADRAYTTALLISEQLKVDPSRIHQNEAVYEASARTLLQVVNQLKDSWNTVLLVGHNPSISYMAEYLSKAEIGDIPSCGLAHLSFDDESWSEITEGSASLVAYETPETLNF